MCATEKERRRVSARQKRGGGECVRVLVQERRRARTRANERAGTCGRQPKRHTRVIEREGKKEKKKRVGRGGEGGQDE